MSAANSGESKVKDMSRLFLSPGMGHCGGGSGALDVFHILSASVNWVEKGQALESAGQYLAHFDLLPRIEPGRHV